MKRIQISRLIRHMTLPPITAFALAGSLIIGISALAPAFAATTDTETETAKISDTLGPQTIKLFEAIRTGSFTAVRQAVSDGASLIARGPEGKTAAELAESLEKYTITHFLRAYENYEKTDDSRVSEEVVETPMPAVVEPTQEPMHEPATVPEPGQTLPIVNLPVVDTLPGTQQVTVQPSNQPTVTEMPTRSETIPEVAQSTTEQAADSLPVGSEIYFSRLSNLNPTPGGDPEPETAVVAAEPEPVDDMALEPKHETDIAEAVVPEAQPESAADQATKGDPMENMPDPMAEPLPEPDTIASMIAGFDPSPGPRKPNERESTEESEIFAAVESIEIPEAITAETEPIEMAESDPLAAPGGTTQSGDEESFFSSMRSFSETQEGLESGDLTAPPENETIIAMKQALKDLPQSAAVDLPEHELIRAAVLQKLREESQDRMSILTEARDAAAEEVQTERQIDAHATGVENVQRDQRVQEYLAAAGTNLSPGYVPPPDGGSSAVRFLQRIGVLTSPEDPQAAMADMKTPIMAALEAIDPGGALTIDERASSFVDSGYSAPPAGSSVDTDDDRSVAVLGQMARLFASPGVGAPSLLGGVPALGSLSPLSQPATSVPNTFGAILPAPAPIHGTPQMAQSTQTAPVILPQNPPSPPAADVTPVPGTLASGNQTGTTLPIDSELQDGWDAVASTQQSAQMDVEPGTPAGLVDRLAHIFDPENPDGVGSGGAIRDAAGNPPVISETTGSWDVISVQAAPSAARVMLAPPTSSGQPLGSNAVLTSGALVLGKNAVLGKGLPMGSDLLAQNKACIQKRNGATTFCIEGLDWSEDIQDQLRVNTVMYQGLNAIVRYDNGVATRFHSLFPSETYAAIVNHYVARMGQPSSVWQRTITPLAAPAQANPAVSWQAFNPATQMHLVLEIRQFDDTRGGFPDEQRGAIMLYNVQAGTIFPQVSAFELMRLRPG